MTHDTVFMFSGQGSQYFHMGRALFETHETFRRWMIRLDELAVQCAGCSVLDTVYSDRHAKGDPFERTLLTNPAIFMVEYALAQSLIDAGVVPDMVLGASLGTSVAATVAGCISVEEAMAAVVGQARAFEASCEPGGMTAVLADPALLDEDFFHQRGELAGVNFSTHFVISAPRAALSEIETELEQRKIVFQRLPVSFAFHSRWIERAREPFLSVMRSIRFQEARVPIACCDGADVRRELSGDDLWGVVRRVVRFRETITRLEGEGAYRYIDLGPSGTLATFLKYTLPDDAPSRAHVVMTPFGTDDENLSTLLAATRN